VKEKENKKLIVGAIFLTMAIILRFLPHIPNFVPITAIALFFGVYFSGAWRFVLPLVAMVVSDIFLGFHSTMFFVYISLILTVVIGHFVNLKKNPFSILSGTLAGSILFFLITNFGVWLTTSWYSPNMSGLQKCFEMAIPFFRNSVIGDIFYVAVFFGAYEIYSAYLSKQLNKEVLCQKKN